MNGAVVAARFPGVSTSCPITLPLCCRHRTLPCRSRRSRGFRRLTPAVKKLQQRLIDSRLPPPRRRRRPVRTGDAERDPRVPEMGAARPDRTTGRPDEGAARHRCRARARAAGAGRKARRDPARPPGRAADQQQPCRADDRSLERKAVDTDPAGRLSGLRKDRSLVVGAVPRVAPVGAAVRRRDRLPRVPGRADLPRLARLRPAILDDRRPLDI